MYDMYRAKSEIPSIKGEHLRLRVVPSVIYTLASVSIKARIF